MTGCAPPRFYDDLPVFPDEELSLIASSHLGLVNDIRFWTANDLLESRLGSEPKLCEGLPRGAAIQNVIH